MTGLLPVSCNKASPPPKAASSVVAASGTNLLHNLGEVSLTNHFETCVKLGGGKNCTVVPRMIDSHNMELTLALESRTPAGKTHDLTVTQVTAKAGKPVEVALGGFQLSFTPKMISE
jgi:hypothetical protein